MSSTKHKLLKICKLKFSNYYEMHSGVANIPIFVEKFIHGICIGKIPIKNLYHLSGQFMLLSVFVAGCGACRAIGRGDTLGEIVPYYVLAFALLYLYLSISAVIDIKGKRIILKTNLIDFLENNMSVRIRQTQKEQERLDALDMLAYQEMNKRHSKREDLTKEEEKELSKLLSEFELLY